MKKSLALSNEASAIIKSQEHPFDVLHSAQEPVLALNQNKDLKNHLSQRVDLIDKSTNRAFANRNLKNRNPSEVQTL